ncbi:chondroitin proteoglycan 4-like isoform X2 [Watersipora subatra]|uniref:chondroitin proteoglycan 4-like isoform X2 n=1 Tax=Watersipora subatra TaxID=2589382 RepID=UPI00355B59B9
MNLLQLLATLLLAHTAMAKSRKNFKRLLIDQNDHKEFNPMLTTKQEAEFQTIVESGDFKALSEFLNYIRRLQPEKLIDDSGEGSGVQEGSGTDDESSGYEGSGDYDDGSDDSSGFPSGYEPEVIDEEEFSGSDPDQDGSGLFETTEPLLARTKSLEMMSYSVPFELKSTPALRFVDGYKTTTDITSLVEKWLYRDAESSWNQFHPWSEDKPESSYTESMSTEAVTEKFTANVKESFRSIGDYSWSDGNVNIGHVPMALVIGGPVTVLIIVLVIVFTICVCRRRRMRYSRRYRQFGDADQLLETEKPYNIV